MDGLRAQITFLYYPQIEPAAAFYENSMDLTLVMDQGWAKIYRIAPGAHLGIVAGEGGFHQPQERNAVLISLVVDDAEACYTRLLAQGVTILRPLEIRPTTGIRTFFLQDPGGYSLEVQEFIDPAYKALFHPG